MKVIESEYIRLMSMWFVKSRYCKSKSKVMQREVYPCPEGRSIKVLQKIGR